MSALNTTNIVARIEELLKTPGIKPDPLVTPMIEHTLKCIEARAKSNASVLAVVNNIRMALEIKADAPQPPEETNAPKT